MEPAAVLGLRGLAAPQRLAAARRRRRGHQRIYGGRMVELDGQPLRRRFAAAVLQQCDADFIAYWTVRRYIGKGAPARTASSRSATSANPRPRSATVTQAGSTASWGTKRAMLATPTLAGTRSNISWSLVESPT